MTQKVLKVGDSAAVTIPKKSLKDLGLAIGDPITVVVDTKVRQVTIKPAESVDPELVAWTDSFIKKYRQALNVLARK